MHVLIMHTNPLFRLGLCSLLEQRGMMVSESIEQEQTLTILKEKQPDIIVVDDTLTWSFHTPIKEVVFTAVEIVASLWRAQPTKKARVFVFTNKPDEEQLFGFMMAGAFAYERTTIASEQFIEKMHGLYNGECLIYQEVGEAPREQIAPKEETAQKVSPAPKKHIKRDFPSRIITLPLYDITGISERHREILRLVAQSYSNREIGTILHISDQTVKHHISAIYNLMGVSDRTAACMIALRMGIISLE